MSWTIPEIPPSIVSTLAEANLGVLDALYGKEFAHKTVEGSLSAQETIDANDALADHLYGAEVAAMVRASQYQRVASLSRELSQEIALDPETIEGLDLDELGLLVVRPEIYSQAALCSRLLTESGFRVVLDRDLTVNFPQYMSLYPHGIAIPETRYDFPTRTLNYVNRLSRLVVFKKDINTADPRPASTIVSEDLKGMQGTFQKNTLRGHIALRALSPYVADGHIVPTDVVALDPLLAYRKLVSGEIASNGVHEEVDHPIMFYMAQGVHVPDRSELQRDFAVLCNEQDIERIVQVKADNEP